MPCAPTTEKITQPIRKTVFIKKKLIKKVFPIIRRRIIKCQDLINKSY